MRTELLIDADIMIYKTASSTEVPINWEGDFWTLHCDFAQTKKLISDQIHALVDKVKADSVLLCFSHHENFRKLLNPEYKLNRKKVRKPMCLNPAKEYCKEEFKWLEKPWLEADDVMGILATKDSETRFVISSEDKDLLTIPGFHWDAENEVVWEQTKDAADYTFYKQILTGDSTDNYSGCPGIGPKKAEAQLQNLKTEVELWNAVRSCFISKKLSDQVAITQARMARILRDGEYSSNHNEPMYWNPPLER